MLGIPLSITLLTNKSTIMKKRKDIVNCFALLGLTHRTSNKLWKQYAFHVQLSEYIYCGSTYPHTCDEQEHFNA